jgi:hypothetical protein
MDASVGTAGGGNSGDDTGGDTTDPNEPEDLCGNDDIDSGEQCDGDNLGGATCSSLGEGEGELACGPACYFDVSGCTGYTNGGGYGGEGNSQPIDWASLLDQLTGGGGDQGGGNNPQSPGRNPNREQPPTDEPTDDDSSNNQSPE